jgi:transposase
MTAWISGQQDWLEAERLPGYAHDLSQIEMAWGNVKAAGLANLCPETLDEARAAAEAAWARVGSYPGWCFAFLARTSLSL